MEQKEWRCKKCGAILGMIRRNGSQVPQLMLLRHSLDMTMEKPAEVELIGPLLGTMPVRCEICDQVRMWGVDVDTLVALLEGLSVEQTEELQVRLANGRAKREERRKNRTVME